MQHINLFRFYPFHYAPYVSDIKDFEDVPFSFNMGTPFLPFEQLLAVLPAASKTLLPGQFQSLMFMEHSPIIDYYPPDFKTDLNGKRQDWEAVVLIPFIDEVCDELSCFYNSRKKKGKKVYQITKILWYQISQRLSISLISMFNFTMSWTSSPSI